MGGTQEGLETPPSLHTSSGTLFKYIQCVTTASEGCGTDEVKSSSGVTVATPKTPAVVELEAKIEGIGTCRVVAYAVILWGGLNRSWENHDKIIVSKI